MPIASDHTSAFEATLPAPTVPAGFRRLLLGVSGAMVSCALLVGLAIHFVDRPVASWVHANLGDARFAWVTLVYGEQPLSLGPFALMAAPAEVLGRAAVFVLAVIAAGAAAGARLRRHARVMMTVSLAVIVALEINRQLKVAFGRTWPESWLGTNPSWIRDGVFGFSPFHGGLGWGSFPSGHTTVITTAATLLWIAWPAFRPLWIGAVVVVMAGLIGGNYHFVSDVIGGLYLGGAIGLSMACMLLSPRDRIGWPVAQAASAKP